MSEGWKLDDLAARSGFSVRTLRYYLSRGLLPAPAFRGPETTYDESYLLRLQAIRALSAAHEPLDAIAERLANVTPDELARLAAGESPAPTRPASPPPTPPGRFAVVRTVRFQLAEGLVLEALDPLPPEAERVLRSVLEHLRGPPAPPPPPPPPPPLATNPPGPISSPAPFKKAKRR